LEVIPLTTLDPTHADLERVQHWIPADTPVTMLNLLRFREEANYPADSGYQPCSGLEA
jgi:hypothetical protein